MLINADELLVHQAPLPFALADSSDHRFYDRCWVAAYNPSGGTAVNFGLGIYKNMNVSDAFLCCVSGDQQHNIRASRRWSSDHNSTQVGPLTYEVVVPFQHIRIRSESENVACELDWHATAAPFIEERSTARIDGRLATDVQRYDQTGSVSGWLDVAHTRIEVDTWFGARDHSWGVRSGVGGFEPRTSSMMQRGSFLITWLLYRTSEESGYIQMNRDHDGNVVKLDGVFRPAAGGPDRHVVAAEQEFVFPPGSRCYSEATMTVRDDGGRLRRIHCSRLAHPIMMRGGGYDNGFADNAGFGLDRGDELVELDAYDLTSEGAPVLLGTADPVPGIQREQAVHVTVDDSVGVGDLTVIAFGDLPYLTF